MIKTVNFLLFFVLFMATQQNHWVDKLNINELRKEFLMLQKSNFDIPEDLHFKVNCYYMRQLFNLTKRNVQYDVDQEADYYTLADPLKVLYNLGYAIEDNITEKFHHNLLILISKTVYQWSQLYKTSDGYPAENLGLYTYKDFRGCLKISEVSVVIHLFLDSGKLLNSESFLKTFLASLYDGDEVIYNLFQNNIVPAYDDIANIDSANMFRSFIVYNYSLLLNQPFEILDFIYRHKEKAKQETLDEFVSVYDFILKNKRLTNENLTAEQKEHTLSKMKSHLAKSGTYLTIYILNKLLHELAGLVKIPILDDLLKEVVKMAHSKLDSLADTYFKNKVPKLFLDMKEQFNHLNNIKSNEVLSLDKRLYKGFQDSSKCRECNAFYRTEQEFL